MTRADQFNFVPGSFNILQQNPGDVIAGVKRDFSKEGSEPIILITPNSLEGLLDGFFISQDDLRL